MKTLPLIFLFAILIYPQEKKMIEIPAIFSDNMVLQQNSEINFWGKAPVNVKVYLTASWGSSSNTTVEQNGLYHLKLKTPSAGGPYQVNLQIDDTTIMYKNVLIGEVWICSGQSNMEMPLMGWPPNDLIINSDEEIKNANDNKIRLFTVGRAVSNEEEFNCNGSWSELNSEIAASFSATALFFGKKLYNELKIPIGLIHTSWGGTPAEAWTSSQYLKTLGVFDKILDDIENNKDELVIYKTWLSSHPVIDLVNNTSESRWEDLHLNDSECPTINFDDSGWKEMELPTLWEKSEVGNFDGIIWFRKSVEIPNEWLNQDLSLNLGPIDDMDRTYVNGKLVGSQEKSGYWSVDRNYFISKEINNSKKLIIAVRVIDTQGGGGLWGDKEKLNIHPVNSNEILSLSGKWKYLPVAEYRAQKLYVFGVTQNNFYQKPKMAIDVSAYTPTSLYNAMIFPLIPYNIRGAIWYQGESNVSDPKLYEKLFPIMIKNWRDKWNLGDFPFYFVQIAPYNYGDQTHSEFLREAQLKTLSVDNTGMAVTLDIGNPQNIHPGDKKDVGERLAFWALSKDYGKKNKYSGPIYTSMKVVHNTIELSFNYSESGLVIKELDGENNFTIAGNDKVFHKANVIINGNKLILSSEQVKDPVAVRYAFTNTSEATLFNNDGLPASSFRTDNWDK